MYTVLHNYNLQPGDRIQVSTAKGFTYSNVSLNRSIMDRAPGWYTAPYKIEVVKEYDHFILFRLYFNTCKNDIISYEESLNKGALACGQAYIHKEENTWSYD